MTLYVRAYDDFSYELIFLEGRVRKKRLHLLVNPSKHVHLPGTSKEGIELNIESLTHIITMQTSVVNNELIHRTTFLAERTNKPIITNSETAELFKEQGLSVRQLRVIGFQQEVVDGIQIDPIYLKELSQEVKEHAPKRPLDPVVDLLKLVNPFSWKPVKRVTKTLFPKLVKPDEVLIDPGKPLAFHIELGTSHSILLPLDKRGMDHINQIIPNMEIKTVVIPNQDISFTKTITQGARQVIILNSDVGEEPLFVPKSQNAYIKHDSIYGSLEEWVEIE